MAQKYVVELLDDIDGTPASDTVEFAFDGVSYVIDLNDDHINELREALDPYLSAARRADRGAKPTRSGGAQPSTGAKRKDLASVREWANANGHPVSSRGRIPQSVVDAFDAR